MNSENWLLQRYLQLFICLPDKIKKIPLTKREGDFKQYFLFEFRQNIRVDKQEFIEYFVGDCFMVRTDGDIDIDGVA